MSIYYVYAYLRSKDSTTAPAGTPYYIGKGSNDRAYAKHYIKVPDRANIIFLEEGLSENKAFEIEKFLIAYHGRKDLGTGILLNKTDGGEGTSGMAHSETTKAKMSESRSGEKNHYFGKKHSEEVRKRISDAKKGRRPNNYGVPCSEEQKKKLSNAHLGKHHSEESKKKISEIVKEYWRKRKEAMLKDNLVYQG